MGEKWNRASGRPKTPVSVHSRKALKLFGIRGEAKKSRHRNTSFVNHITPPTLNENLVGLSHRLITAPPLPGRHTNLAFPQAGVEF